MAEMKNVKEESLEESIEHLDEVLHIPTETKAQRRLRLIKEHLWGPTGSFILHVVLVIVLIFLVQYNAPPKSLDYETKIVDPVTENLEELPPLETLEPLEVTEKMESELPTVDRPPEVVSDTVATPQVDTSALDIKTDALSPMVMKNFFANRTPSGRNRMLGRFAGRYGGRVEGAINKALRWLRDNQKPDGSWQGAGGANNTTAMTGLGLLTFLAHGETTQSKEFGATVDKAIRWLISKQGSNGEFDRNSYANGIALYAVSEGYAMTRIPALREAMEKGARVVLKGMQNSGCFTYNYAHDGRRDTSVTGWQAQALKAAFIAEAEIEGLKDSLDKIASGLKSNFDSSKNEFRYAPPEASHTTKNCTGIGALSLQLLGYGNEPEVRAAVTTLTAETVKWDDPREWGLYGWYYMTQAMFHTGGPTWTKWNDMFAKEFLDNQNEDGSWQTRNNNEQNYGKVYGTTLTALTLMVYYRNLPTYGKIELGDESAPPPADTTAEEPKVEII